MKMSAKFMYPLSDENPDLQKQIGCMNGLFHHFLGSRRFATPSHKCLPPGNLLLCSYCLIYFSTSFVNILLNFASAITIGSIGKHGTEAKIASQRIKVRNCLISCYGVGIDTNKIKANLT